MTEQSMIERVARAIASKSGEGCPELEYEKHWQEWIPEAKAAIEAMREPTDAMIKDGEVAANDMQSLSWSPCNIPERTWQAMIDAALNEEVK